jgi:cyclopropane fatty-acyl-phospholipid synthase-like methyltransferase
MNIHPWSAAAERNREPILDVLRRRFAARHHVLEIGSGSGQHALHVAAAMRTLIWQATERDEHVHNLRAALAGTPLPNTPPPLTLDVASGPWPTQRYDAVFSANTLHIMGWTEVEALFAALPSILADDATLVVYGPFNVDGAFTSASNAAFDASLKARGAHMGLRDIGAVDALARAAGLRFVDDVTMPANNRCLVWERGA